MNIPEEQHVLNLLQYLVIIMKNRKHTAWPPVYPIFIFVTIIQVFYPWFHKNAIGIKLSFLLLFISSTIYATFWGCRLVSQFQVFTSYTFLQDNIGQLLLKDAGLVNEQVTQMRLRHFAVDSLDFEIQLARVRECDLELSQLEPCTRSRVPQSYFTKQRFGCIVKSSPNWSKKEKRSIDINCSICIFRDIFLYLWHRFLGTGKTEHDLILSDGFFLELVSYSRRSTKPKNHINVPELRLHLCGRWCQNTRVQFPLIKWNRNDLIIYSAQNIKKLLKLPNKWPRLILLFYLDSRKQFNAPPGNSALILSMYSLVSGFEI